MSRIYEALQKAESERKLERREPELGIPDQSASAAVTRPVRIRTQPARSRPPGVLSSIEFAWSIRE